MKGNSLPWVAVVPCSKRKLLTWSLILLLTSLMVIYWTASTLGLDFFMSNSQRHHESNAGALNRAFAGRTVLTRADLLHAVEKLSFRTMTASSLLLEDLYFIPTGYIHAHYNNTVLHQPEGECSGTDFLLILVPSHPQSTLVRRAIRETWGVAARGRFWPWTETNYPVKLIFVLGLRDNQGSPETDSNADLIPEIASFDDILQFDMIDTYQNLTRKIILALQWATQSCKSVRYILKVDQDVFVNVPLITAFLQQNGENNSIYGRIYGGSWVIREGKWAVAKSALPIPKYPIYAAGNAYVLSKDAAEIVIKLAPEYPYIHVEDAFITGILASVGRINRVNVVGFTKWTESRPDACEFVNNKRYVGNNFTDYDLRLVWRDLIDGGGGRCNR